MNTERVEAGPYKAELIDGLWMVTGPNGWKSHNGDCRDRFDSDMVAKRMNYAHTAALAAADSVGMSGDGVAMAWAVNCPARHECDFLVFHDPQEAEVQAEQWNEDHDEGENPHKVIPLYPADDSASGEKVVYTATESTLFAKVFQGAPAGSSFFLQPGEELVVRKVRG